MKIKYGLAIATLCAVLMLLVAQPTAAAPRAADDPCASLMDLKLPVTKITVAETLNNPEVRPSGVVVHGVWKTPKSAHGQTTVSTKFCRVAGVVDRAINFEVWMPVEDWNGKFNGVARRVHQVSR